MRLLAAIRLSNLTDTTTSPATQRDEIIEYADEHNHEIVAWTEDLDVSGGVPIRDRPGVGPWLAEDKLEQWDAIIGHRLDRLFRSQLDFLLWVRDFGERHNKIIIDVEGGIDTSTRAGKRELNHRAEAAENERERAAERRARAAKRMRLLGHWGGAKVPFGYRPVKVIDPEDDSRHWWELEPDPEHRKTVEWVADQVIAGRSVTSLCTELNERGVPTAGDAERIRRGRQPKGAKWKLNILMHVLRSPVLTGHVLAYPDGRNKPGILVLGKDGMPVRRKPLISDEKWQALQEALKSMPQQRRHDRAPLTGVTLCALCGSAMHAHRQRPGREYYLCSGRQYDGCRARGVRMEALEAAVDESFTVEFGSRRKLDRRWQPGDDHSAAKAKVGQQIAELNEERFVRGVKRPDFGATLAKLTARYDELDAMPAKPGKWVPVDTGMTLGQYWAALDMRGKGRLIMDMGLRVIAARTAEQPVLIEWVTDAGETDQGEPVTYPRPWASQAAFAGSPD